MIAAILGGAVGVWSQLAKLREVADVSLVVACNDAGVTYPGHLDGWATLHPEKFGTWRARRRGNGDYRAFSIKLAHGCGDTEIVPERWRGSSGLYAAQIALDEFGADKAVLCGVPLIAKDRHFFDRNNEWSDAENYRKGFQAALPVIRDRVRSMSGWTRELLGEPSPEWLN